MFFFLNNRNSPSVKQSKTYYTNRKFLPQSGKIINLIKEEEKKNTITYKRLFH